MKEKVRTRQVSLVVGSLALVTIGWACYEFLAREKRHETFLVARLHEANEALALRIIADFHQNYNLKQGDPKSDLGALIASKLQGERDRLGDFLGLKQCTVRGIEEPPELQADCTSSFTNGDAHEVFMMHRARSDSHLLNYSIQWDGEEISIPY